jgi:release factor glutamine methyltransferase
MNKLPQSTIQTWIQTATSQLTDKGITSARIDSQLILCQALGKDRAFILSHPETVLPTSATAQADVLLRRRMQHEPLAYIIGEKEFFGLTFKTDKRALIPRWESEILVESAIAWLKNQDSPQIVVEVGTGSGAIILAVAKLYPQHSFIASDISPEALDLARENTHSLGLENITFLPGNLGEPLIEAGYHHKVNLLLANLPYIPSSLLTTLDPTVHYFEPTLALDGGLEGLDLYTQFLPYVCKLLPTSM